MVLVRHGDKQINPLDDDVALSAQGQQQAQNLAERVQTGRLPTPTRLLSSPKRRARATLQPLSLATGLPLEIKAELDERGRGESKTAFEARIHQFVSSLTSEVVYCCSHADWLYELVTSWDSDVIDTEMEAHFTCAQTRIFEWHDGMWRLHSSWKG